MTADRSHVAAIDALFRVAHDWMVRNEDTIVALVADRGPAQGFFLAHAAHEAVGRRVHNELCRWLADALADPDHRARAAIDTWLTEVAVRLREDPELIAKVEDFKAQTLASAEVQAAVASCSARPLSRCCSPRWQTRKVNCAPALTNSCWNWPIDCGPTPPFGRASIVASVMARST